MQLPEPIHQWNIDRKEAIELQFCLSKKLQFAPLPSYITRVAGVDLAVDKNRGLFFAVAVVMTYPDLDMLEVKGARAMAPFPYIPGLLSFREGPAIIAAFKKLNHRPDVIIFDGQGIAHPRRFGLAAHLGLWLKIPSIGCAKSRLIGTFSEPGTKKGDRQALMVDNEIIGSVLRTRDNVKPVFVSPGHLCDVPGAGEIVLCCCKKFRLPEPTRAAHKKAAEMKHKVVD